MYMKKLLAGMATLIMLAVSLLSFAPLLANADTLPVPDGYVGSMNIKVYSPLTTGLRVTTSHYYWDAVGDYVQVIHYPDDLDGDCYNDGIELYVNGSLVALDYSNSGDSVAVCAADYAIGQQLYVLDNLVTVNAIQGGINVAALAGGSNSNYYTTVETPAGWAEWDILANMGAADSDDDGVNDEEDNCPNVQGAQTDTDGDGIGDLCDDDVDGDSTPDATDNCPLIANYDQYDYDGDGMGDLCDDDPDSNGQGWGDTDDVGTIDDCAWLDWNDWCMPIGVYAPQVQGSDEMCVMWELGGPLECSDASDGCVWVDYYGDCVDYDVWAPASHDQYESCVVYSGTSPGDMECTDGYLGGGFYCEDGNPNHYNDWGFASCNICYSEDDSVENFGCGDETYDDVIGSYRYYVEDDGLMCTLAYDTDGMVDHTYCVTEMSCWADACETERHYEEWLCYQHENNSCETCFNQDNWEVIYDTCEVDNGDDEDDDDDDDPDEPDDPDGPYTAEENIRWMEESLNDYGREMNRLDHVIEDYEHRIEDWERERVWFKEDGWSTYTLDNLLNSLEGDIGSMRNLMSNMESSEGEFNAELSYIKNYVDSAVNDHDPYWLIVNKGQTYGMQLDIYRMDVGFYEMNMGFQEWNFERMRLETELDEFDIDVPREIQDGLDDGKGTQIASHNAYDDYLDVADEALALIDLIDGYDLDQSDELWDLFGEFWDMWDELQWAADDFWHTMDDQWRMWDVFEDAWELIGFGHDMDWIYEEITWIREDVTLVENAFSILQGKATEAYIAGDIADVLEIAPLAYEMLNEIEQSLGNVDSPEEMDALWEDLNGLSDFVQPKIDHVVQYIYNHDLDLSPSELDVINRFLEMEDCSDYGCGDREDDRYKDRLKDAYNEDIAFMLGEYITDDMVNSLIQEITASVMDAVAQFVEDELADRIMNAVVGNMELFTLDKWGDNFANDLLNNGNRVFEQMSVVSFGQANSDKPLMDDLEDLHDMFTEMPMPEEELAGEVADYWKDAATVVSANPSTEELQTLISEGTDLLEEATAAKYEANLGYTDVPGPFDEGYDDSWFAEAVIEGAGERWEGYKDVDGNLTYEYGASDTALRAEVLKMMLASLGHTESGSGANWWSGWENRGAELGLSIVDLDLTQSITRGETFRLLAELGSFELGTYQGYFPDVSVLDDYAPVEALYIDGIVTGDGATGEARLSGLLNRAEVAALVKRVVDFKEGQAFLEGDFAAYNEVEDPKNPFSDFWVGLSRLLSQLVPANMFR